MDLAEKMREEEYGEYLEDVKIAVSELTNMKLYPVEGNIVCDLYAITSHNFQSYYAIVYENDDRYEMLYAKPQIYDPVVQEYIKMYGFKDAKEAENHPAKDGKIIMGIKQLSEEYVNELKDIADNLPFEKKSEEDYLTLDGYFQVIRIYKNNVVSDVLVFNDVEDLVFPDKKDYLSKILDELYIEVGKIIEQGG